MSRTLEQVLDAHGIAVADETLAGIEVPVLVAAQRQGDVLIVPRKSLSKAERAKSLPVTAAGIAVVRGEATGNTHLLHAFPDATVTWLPSASGATVDDLLMGVVTVESGVGYLIHTDEHGANAMGVGTFALHGKREQADIVRRVAD